MMKPNMMKPLTLAERLKAYENLSVMLRAHESGRREAMNQKWDELFGKAPIEKAVVDAPGES